MMHGTIRANDLGESKIMTIGEYWAYGSAFVVLVGVIGESVASLTTWVKSEKRRSKLEKISALLLILGLAGDVMSIRMTQIATSSLNAEAARANERAATAEERVAEAEKEVETARADSAIARKDAEAYRLQIAQANERADRAERQATRAQVGLARFKAPRALTLSQQQACIMALSTFPGAPVDVFIFGETPEIAQISATILDCMARAKWDLHSGTVAGSGVAVAGIFVGVDPNGDSTAKRAAQTFAAFLDSVGIGCKLVEFSQLQFKGAVELENTSITFRSPIRIFIGAKPTE